jgi:hypothetical protein
MGRDGTRHFAVYIEFVHTYLFKNAMRTSTDQLLLLSIP